jgi:HK97 family phage major capsid protein
MAFKKIQEYINTDDGVEGTLLIPKLIMPPLIEEVDKNLIPREMAAQVWGPNQIQGSSFTVNLETPDTLDLREVAEGAEVVLDSIDFETVTYTPKKYGVAIRITREMMEDSQFELLQRNIRIAGKRFAENETNLICGALDGANATTAGGAAIVIANIAESMYDVEENDYTPTDYLLGNEQVQDLRNIDTFVEADKAGNREMMERGFIGTIFNMNVARYSTNAGTNCVATSGYIFDRTQAYGIAIKRDISVEQFNMATYDMQGAVLTQRIDVQLLRSKAVSKITSS